MSPPGAPARSSYYWPPTLIRPDSELQLVYLDLNHWIGLAKALAGHPTGTDFKDVAAACLSAVESGSAVFPLSDTILFEVTKIANHRQRRSLRIAMEHLSRFMVITARSVISTHEIEAMLDETVGPSPDPIRPMRYLDWGVARALGKVGGFRIMDSDGRDVTDDARSAYPDGPEAFDERLLAAEIELNRRMLEGPTREEEPELRALGWRPRAASEVAARRAQQEIQQAELFDQHPEWRGRRIRHVVAAREVLIEINDALSVGLNRRGATIEDAFPEPTSFSRASDSMPSFDAAVTIKLSLHRNRYHRWTPNDIHDIDALGSALPYCNLVVVDKAMKSHVERSGLHERLGTTVLSRLQELPALL